MPANGIDVSEYQQGTDITKISGLDFVIAKATQGTTITDPTYEEWAGEAEKAGAQFGAYHFARAELLNARAQADFFSATARLRSGLSAWIDYETYGASGQADAEFLGYFAREVQYNSGSKRQKIGIYCNKTGLSRIKPWLHEIPYSALWLADPSSPMTTQNPGMAWQVHQYEVFEGIDRNYSTWSRADWESFWKW